MAELSNLESEEILRDGTTPFGRRGLTVMYYSFIILAQIWKVCQIPITTMVNNILHKRVKIVTLIYRNSKAYVSNLIIQI